jgi:hypothetical protein
MSAREALHRSDSNEWYTPAPFVEAARAVMGGIDLDPASCALANATVRAAHFYTQEANGLHRPWFGRVFLNPPYGKTRGRSNQEIWSFRLLDEYRRGVVEQAVLLVNAATGTTWFTPLKAYPICFPDGRIAFYNAAGPQDSPTHSNALIYLGPHVARFVAVFSDLGRVMTPLALGPDGRLVIDIERRAG